MLKINSVNHMKIPIKTKRKDQLKKSLNMMVYIVNFP